MGRNSYCMTGPPTRTTKEQMYTPSVYFCFEIEVKLALENAQVFFGILEERFRKCFLKLNLMHLKYY